MTREELAKAMWEAAEKAPGQGTWNNPYKWDDPVMENVRSRYLAAADVAIAANRETRFTDETFWRDTVDEDGNPTGERYRVRRITAERAVVAGVSLELSPQMPPEAVEASKGMALGLLEERIARMDREDSDVRPGGFEPTRWWRAVGPDGEVWCESSDEGEVRERARPGDRVEHLWSSTKFEWRSA